MNPKKELSLRLAPGDTLISLQELRDIAASALLAACYIKEAKGEDMDMNEQLRGLKLLAVVETYITNDFQIPVAGPGLLADVIIGYVEDKDTDTPIEHQLAKINARLREAQRIRQLRSAISNPKSYN